MCRIGLAVVGWAMWASVAASDQQLPDVEVATVLVQAKMAGACGIMRTLIDFQNQTKMPGGDEFVARFYAWELARLGQTIESYFAVCEDSIEKYDWAMEAIDSTQFEN